MQLRQLLLVDGRLGVLELPLRDLLLDDLEAALIVLPFAGIVVPDHPDDGEQAADGHHGEDEVELVDIARVHALALSHRQPRCVL